MSPESVFYRDSFVSPAPEIYVIKIEVVLGNLLLLYVLLGHMDVLYELV